MKKNLKRNIVMAAVLLFVCAAVYLNWSYNSKAGEADSAEEMEETVVLDDEVVDETPADEE